MKNRWTKTLLLLAAWVLAAGLQAQEAPGTCWGELELGPQKLLLVFHFDKDEAGAPVCTIDSPQQGATGIPARVERLTADSLKVNVEALQMTYEARRTGTEWTGTFVQGGMSLPLVLKQGEPEDIRPQTPRPPYPYATEDVTFTNAGDGAVLGGTLTYPLTYTLRKPAQVPVVLMVSGSGLQNRDEEIMSHRPFAVWADFLAKNGIASLRYDDRGVGASSGETADATTQTFMKDAEAGTDYLRRSGKFGKVGVLGHSEGGLIAFMLASAGKADFIVSLAGPAVRGDVLLAEQNKALLRLSGLPEEVCETYGTAFAELVNMEPEARTAADWRTKYATLPEPLLANLENIPGSITPWLEFFIAYDPTEAIRTTRCPVMAINGSKDSQVPASLNLEALRKLLPANEANNIKEYSDLNHLFQHCQTGGVEEYGSIPETVSEEVLREVAAWINGLK